MNEAYRFLIVIEKSRDNFASYCPDLPGCIATGKTKMEVEKNMQEALKLHVQGLLEDGLEIPQPLAEAEFVVFHQPKKLARTRLAER